MIRHDAWRDEELQLLYDVVNDIDWFPKVAGKIDRSPNAIRVRMSNLRMEAGIIPKQLGNRSVSQSKAHRDNISLASARLARAIRELREAEMALESAA